MLAGKRIKGSSHRNRAFTLTDLMAVLAVVLILAAIQPPSVANTQGKGRIASCLYNHRQLVRAWQLFAQDNAGGLPGNFDGGGAMRDLNNTNRTWTLGWLENSYFVEDNTNTFYLTAAQLGRYTRSAGVYKCPADKSLSVGTGGAPRVRSLSMNGYMGQIIRSGPYNKGYWQFRKLSEIVDPSPSRAFVFIDEREDSINDGVLFIDMTGFDPKNPSAYIIVDFPADWHNRGANLSFVDGHTETWRWRDPRTIPGHVAGAPMPLNVATPNNPDVARIQAATSSRVR